MIAGGDFGGTPISSAEDSFCESDSGAETDCGDSTASVEDTGSSFVEKADSPPTTAFSGVLCLAASAVRQVSSSCSAGNAVVSAFLRRSVSVRLCANGTASRINAGADSASIRTGAALLVKK